jgi:cysteine synthase A
MNIANTVTDLIGNTPLVASTASTKAPAPPSPPSWNSSTPAHSVKDRIGEAMLDAADRRPA